MQDPGVRLATTSTTIHKRDVPGKGPNRFGREARKERGNMRYLALLLTLLVIVLTPPIAGAAGFQNYLEQSIVSMTQGGAMVARADDASVLYYNPAAATRVIDPQLQAVFCGVNPQTTYLSTGGSTEPSSVDMGSGLIPLGAGHLLLPSGERWTLGFAINTPYGSHTEWSPTWEGRYFSDYTSLKAIEMCPSAAYSLTPDLSLGVGMIAAWAQAKVNKAINAPLVYAGAVPEMASLYQSGAFNPENDVLTRLEGDGWGWGARAGLLWELGESWSLGMAYHTAIAIDMSGRATYESPDYDDESFGRSPQAAATANQLATALFPDTNIETSVDLPASLHAGLGWQTSDRVWMEFDLSWTEWSSYDSLTVTYDELMGSTSAVSSMPKLWEDAMAYRLGVSYAVSPNWVARLGYAYDESPIPDETRDPSLPGANRHDISMGVGYDTGRWGLDAGYLQVRFEDTVSELSSPANGELSGDYQGTAHVFGVSTTVRF